jgi:hypothetical protein
MKASTQTTKALLALPPSVPYENAKSSPHPCVKEATEIPVRYLFLPSPHLATLAHPLRPGSALDLMMAMKMGVNRKWKGPSWCQPWTVAMKVYRRARTSGVGLKIMGLQTTKNSHWVPSWCFWTPHRWNAQDASHLLNYQVLSPPPLTIAMATQVTRASEWLCQFMSQIFYHLKKVGTIAAVTNQNRSLAAPSLQLTKVYGIHSRRAAAI